MYRLCIHLIIQVFIIIYRSPNHPLSLFMGKTHRGSHLDLSDNPTAWCPSQSKCWYDLCIKYTYVFTRKINSWPVPIVKAHIGRGGVACSMYEKFLLHAFNDSELAVYKTAGTYVVIVFINLLNVYQSWM